MATRSLLRSCAWLLLAASLTVTARAQESKSTPTPAARAPSDALGRTTPRGTVVNFLRAISDEDYRRAAKYLQTRLPVVRAERLAMETGTVLNRRFQIELERLSRQPDGNPDDDSQPNRDLIGVIPSQHGPVEVALERVNGEGDTKIWLFSEDTLKEIPELYRSTDDFWLEAYVPDRLKDTQILNLPVWRWLTWILGLALAWGGSLILQSVLRLIWPPILRRLDPDEPQPATLALSGPLRVFFFALILMFLSSFAATILARQFWFRVGATIGVFSGGWLLSRMVDAAAAIAGHRMQKRTGLTQSSAIWLMQRAGKVVIGLVGILILLKLVRVELTAVLTGLGIGGLAFAFAAQKTIENLFGGVMITTDGSLRVGDFCRIGDLKGEIVDIGIRSTRIRTLERTMVSIPNGHTASVSIENYSMRDKFHFYHVVGVRYETDAALMEKVLEALRAMLAVCREVERGTVRVRFIRFGGSSLDIEMRAHVFAANYDVFLEIQERMLLAVMKTLEAHGAAFAFPSQTLYLAKDK